MRLFAAVELPETARRALAARVTTARQRLPPASWVRPENLHLTLAFFGEVAGELVEPLAAALGDAARAAGPPFPAGLGEAGAFPERGPLRVVWVALTPEAPLAALASALRDAARGAGVEVDGKRFHPHVTLARCRRPWPARWRGELEALAPGPEGDVEVERAVLLASELAPGGSRYRRMAELPLGRAA